MDQLEILRQRERRRRYHPEGGALNAMLIDTNTIDSLRPAAFGSGSQPAPVMGVLPGGITFCERAVAAVRSFLIVEGLSHYRIFYAADLDLGDIEEHLDALGEAPAAWQAPAPSVSGGEPMALIQTDDDHVRGIDAGCIRLARHEVVLARWFWVDHNHYQRTFSLCAAPSPEHYLRLLREVRQLRRSRRAAVWQILRDGYDSDERIERGNVEDSDLILSDAIRQRVEAEVVRFFSAEVAALYRDLGVPHRRGVLLHGPPGNGKTSLIRLIGARLPEVPGMILRPDSSFDTDAMTAVVERWTRQAPSILVIEDLDWLLKTVNVSTFLNMLDGLESTAEGGLLLIATTNHPDALDPAVNNRPGRFDVVIEIPSPDERLRLEFLTRKLPAIAPATLRRAAAETDGLAFAHLQEVLRLSGLLAINAARTERTAEDLLRAVDSVRRSHEDAVRGFPTKPDMPFGLAHLREARQRAAAADED